ncbi:nucleotide-binding protein [Verrucomicrobium sp. BvORR034]|uniref:TIR domain-containing protein n=1 Tax=Verrucomicrobium sp. BvORR034 TaxID=1396418 RepID=UPI000679C300|nr:nucleotide-binding protein [Verrucomicrobium sp. BvORR034]
MRTSTRPVVFIGSSSEGLPIAEALQANLDHNAEAILWSQGVFGLSTGTLETLVSRLSEFDFAILILTADDLTLSRGTESASPRDNVVFELGLFMGALGRTRTFIVYDRTKNIRLPSDLAGVSAATYQPPSAGTLQSALGACTTAIRSAIQAQGRRVAILAETPIRPEDQFRVIASLLDNAALQFLILMMESGTSIHREASFNMGIRYELSINLNGNRNEAGGYFSVARMSERLADAGLLTIDLRGQVGLTDRGIAFAKWLATSGYKANYFWSDLGTWGERPVEMLTGEDSRSLPRNFFELQAREDNPQPQIEPSVVDDQRPSSST